MNIGSIIKELRQKRKMSQEELATYLGVSTQAVSRWETSVTFPDITLLPRIANVFSVTTDYLLGTDRLNNDKIIQEVDEAYRTFLTKGDNVGCYEYMKEMYNKYPHIEYIHLTYANACADAYNEDESYIDEGINVLNQLIRITLDNQMKDRAYESLFWLYLNKKKKEKAKDIFNKKIRKTLKKDWYSSHILEGEELAIYSQKQILCATQDIWSAIISMRNEGLYNLEDEIQILDKYNKILSVLYENEDYGIQELWHLVVYNRRIAMNYLKLDKIDEALNYIELCVEYAIRIDVRENVMNHTSVLFNRIQDKKDSISHTGNKKEYGNESYSLYKNLTVKAFDKVKDHPRFIALLEKLSLYIRIYN